MEELVWRKKGEKCERSYREPKLQSKLDPKLPQPPTIANNEGFRKVSNKREEANEKMNERYLIGQSNQNPFMTQSNYINDLEVQMNFLTPTKEY